MPCELKSRVSNDEKTITHTEKAVRVLLILYLRMEVPVAADGSAYSFANASSACVDLPSAPHALNPY